MSYVNVQFRHGICYMACLYVCVYDFLFNAHIVRINRSSNVYVISCVCVCVYSDLSVHILIQIESKFLLIPAINISRKYLQLIIIHIHIHSVRCIVSILAFLLSIKWSFVSVALIENIAMTLLYTSTICSILWISIGFFALFHSSIRYYFIFFQSRLLRRLTHRLFVSTYINATKSSPNQNK